MLELLRDAAIAAGKIVKVADTGQVAPLTPGTGKAISAVEKINNEG